MSDKGKPAGKGGRHPTGKALRYLFASGILKGSGSGKHREVSYSRKRAGQVKAMRARGLKVTQKMRFRNTPSGSTRHVFGGNSARLQSGRGSEGGKPKPDHSATRERRIFEGLSKARTFMQSRKGEFGHAIERKWDRQGKLYSRRGVDREADRLRRKASEQQRAWETRSGVWMSKYKT